MAFILNNIIEIFSGLAALIAGGYVWYLKNRVKKVDSVNRVLKEEVAISRIINSSLKKQYENKVKLDEQKAKLKDTLNNSFTE